MALLNFPTAPLKKKRKNHPKLCFLLNNSGLFQSVVLPVKWERCCCGGLYSWGHFAVTQGQNTPCPR